MRTSGVSKLLFALAASACLWGCSRPGGLIGKWQSDTIRKTSPRDPRLTAEAYQIAEFSKEGKFKITVIMKGSDGKSLALPMYTGAFALIDTNHMKLDLVANALRPDSKISVPVGFWISGNELTMDSLSPGDGPPEKWKFRRVSR